eukprot:2374388-Lingulodinium_polyedra.AAC.1
MAMPQVRHGGPNMAATTLPRWMSARSRRNMAGCPRSPEGPCSRSQHLAGMRSCSTDFITPLDPAKRSAK